MAARIKVGSKIRCGYRNVKAGLGYKSGEPYRLYGKRIQEIR